MHLKTYKTKDICIHGGLQILFILCYYVHLCVLNKSLKFFGRHGYRSQVIQNWSWKNIACGFPCKKAKNFISQEAKWVMGHPIHQSRCSFCAELIKNTIRTVKSLFLWKKFKIIFFRMLPCEADKKIHIQIIF